ncbi:MAG: hypothetical protein JNJ76_06640 [Candidatus Competibacter sp.]|nr:hypothetical protein [Candidatus Competibacter sp.]
MRATLRFALRRLLDPFCFLANRRWYFASRTAYRAVWHGLPDAQPSDGHRHILEPDINPDGGIHHRQQRYRFLNQKRYKIPTRWIAGNRDRRWLVFKAP